MVNSANKDESQEREVSHGISPSAFMRELRPEYYSDTRDRVSYALSSQELEYALETITSRNQTHDFEIFCRKLCERSICPNLRPQTGPEGGGDSKVDTETYPVADEITSLVYVGDANAGREKWAFAFSAKAKWADKARKDVKGVIESGRKYDRIFIVTSRFARSKDRARVEQELTKQYGVPVVIHDRSWIVKEIIENDRTDLAFNYLQVGKPVDDFRLGPTDYSRRQQLDEIEASIGNPDAFRGMELQRTTEALIAARLSRGLERPRTETDGRFARAIRLADEHGTFRQKLEAKYELIWTAFWWFDDFDFVNANYNSFESEALKSTSAKDLEFISNLHQLLVNSIVHNGVSLEKAGYERRTARLKAALEAIAHDPDRPNNSLEARVNLLRIRINQALIEATPDALPPIWSEFSKIVDEAEGLGEFDADRLVSFVNVVGQMAGNEPTYNELVEKIAAFVGSRKSEGEAALILLRRSQSLGLEDRFDMIRWLGKAAVGLTKREYSPYLIEATQLLSVAYRSAGLCWAARANCFLAAASIVIDGEEDSELQAGIVPTVKLMAWIALELGHLPDFLTAIQSLNGFLVRLPLTDESKRRLASDIQELDMALGCLLLNLEDADLTLVAEVPDILEALGLLTARTALLYALGYEDVLRSEGSLPEQETDRDVAGILSVLKSQPIAATVNKKLVLNQEATQIFSTKVFGVTIQVDIDRKESIVIAEMILGALEAFFATTINRRDIMPYTELYRITVRQSDKLKEPHIQTSEHDMSSTVTWPSRLASHRFTNQREVQPFLAVVAGHVMAAACMIEDSSKLLNSLYEDEAVHQRVAVVAAATNSYSRFSSRWFSSLSDWQTAVRRAFPPRDSRPNVPRVQLSPDGDEENAPEGSHGPRELNIYSHKEVVVHSVIDVRTWNAAKWRGCGYVQQTRSTPFYMALLFEDEGAGRKIFERWRERFGSADSNEEILVSIIRELPNTNSHHYLVQLTSAFSAKNEEPSRHPVLTPSRSLTMEPETNDNLNMFLAGWQRFGRYFMIPGTISTSGSQPKFFPDLAIEKRTLTVVSASNVRDQDLESVALKIRGMHSGSS